LVINPDECIDCNKCLPLCPVDAIVHEDDASQEYIDINANFNFDDEDKRVEEIEDVKHGPDWDAKKA